ncbi:hypothetical protein ACVRZD_08585 [Streptococcus hongkongensis]
MKNNILKMQPIDDDLLKAIEIYNDCISETDSVSLSILRIFQAGKIEGKRIERAKKWKN